MFYIRHTGLPTGYQIIGFYFSEHSEQSSVNEKTCGRRMIERPALRKAVTNSGRRAVDSGPRWCQSIESVWLKVRLCNWKKHGGYWISKNIVKEAVLWNVISYIGYLKRNMYVMDDWNIIWHHVINKSCRQNILHKHGKSEIGLN